MAKFDFKDPSRPVKVPPWTYLRSLVRLLALRSLRPKWSFAIWAWAYRVKMRLRPKRRERMAQFLRPVVSRGTTAAELERHISLSLTVRRIGAYTYAPIFRRSRKWLLRTLRPEGLEYLDEVKRRGRGAIILGSGLGLKAWAGPILRQLGYPARFMQRKRVTAEVLLLMRWDGAVSEVLPYPEDPEGGIHLKRLHDLVKAGAWIRHAVLHPVTANGLRGKVLNYDVRWGRAPWLIARLTGAPLIPLFVFVDRDFSLRFLVHPPIYVDAGASAQDAMRSAFQAYLDLLSQHIRRMPWNLIVPSRWEDLILANREFSQDIFKSKHHPSGR